MTQIEISLDKQSYTSGGKVNGTFKLTHGDGWFDKAVEVKIYLEATGVEKTKVLEKVTVTVPADIDVNKDGVINADDTVNKIETIQHSQSSLFWKKAVDLPLQMLGTPTANGYILIDRGTKQAPFEFDLTSDHHMLESYNGTDATIWYQLSAKVDKKLALDVHKEIGFVVTENHEVSTEYNAIKENVKNEYLELELEVEKDMYAPGDKILGKLTLKNPSSGEINLVEIGLRGTEVASADKLQSQNNSDYKQAIPGNWNMEDSKSFEFIIPIQAKRSYLGQLSKYSWEIIAMVNMSSKLGSDLHVSHTIRIA